MFGESNGGDGLGAVWSGQLGVELIAAVVAPHFEGAHVSPAFRFVTLSALDSRHPLIRECDMLDSDRDELFVVSPR